MPTCVIATTEKFSKSDGQAIIKKISQTVAKMLGKPEHYVTVRLEQDQIMCHGGSTDPCASVILYSIGGVSGAANKQHTCTLGEAVAKELGIRQDRFYITYVNVKPSDCGIDGNTFG